MKKALISGVGGFVGAYLGQHLFSKGYSVFGIDRWPQCPLEKISYSPVNILDTAELTRHTAAIRPDEIYHLAAVSYLPDADASPSLAFQINILGSIAVFDAIKNTCPGAIILTVGSSKEYNNTSVSDSIGEEVQPDPTDFYGISKYSVEMIGKQYVRQFGQDIRFCRSFNHTGPGQPPKFVCSDWAKQIAEIELGLCKPVIKVGNLDAQIDFSDVRDVVRAYHAIVSSGTKGEVYNVCSGTANSLRVILKYLIAKSRKKITISSVEKKQRAHATSPRLVGDNKKLRSQTGWKPQIPLEKTLDELYDYWIKELKKNKPSLHD